MTTSIEGGWLDRTGQRDAEGYRTYKIKWLIRGDLDDGPAMVMNTPGLPLPGSFWNFGNDVDLWAWCRHDATVSPYAKNAGESNRFWTIEQTFSNKPLPQSQQGCQDQTIENPLLEPQKVSGAFKSEKVEATTDRFGIRLTNSAHEQLRGPMVEFDEGSDTIRITQNVANLQLPLLVAMRNSLNDRPLWGLPRRCIKFDNYTWEAKYHGQCFKYYTRELEFNCRFPITVNSMIVSAFDRDILDEGTKVIRGKWDKTKTSPTYKKWVADSGASRFNPRDFIRFKDWNGENSTVILNGEGAPFDAESEANRAVSAFPEWTFSPDQLGQDYKAGDILTLTGGTALQAAQFVVISATEFPSEVIGQLKQVSLFTAGSYTTVPTNPVTVTGGSGTGGQLTVQWRTEKTPGNIRVEKYPETNFLLLGIPLDF